MGKERGDDLEKIIDGDSDFLEQENTRFEVPLKKLLIPQSGTGHAHEGHCGFRGRKFPNLTIEEYFNILTGDSSAFIRLRQERQAYLNRNKRWCDRSVEYLKRKRNGEPWEKVLDEVRSFSIDGFALCGLPHHRLKRVYDHRSVLKGVYLGAHLDNEDSRKRLNIRIKKVFESYLRSNPNDSPKRLKERLKKILKEPLRRGVTKAVNMERLLDSGLSLSGLSNYGDSAKKSFLKEQGFVDDRGRVINIEFVDALINSGIITDSSNDFANPNIVSGYIELSPGIGVSDDIAYMSAGLMHNPNFSKGYGKAFGFNISDFNDTLDVVSMEITSQGQDEMIGLRTNAAYKKFAGYDLVEYEKILAWMYMARRMRGLCFPSSSQRYLWRTSNSRKEYGISAMEIYNEFMERIINNDLDNFHPKNIPIDFDKIPITNVFRDFKKRWNQVREECRETGIFPVEYFPDYFPESA